MADRILGALADFHDMDGEASTLADLVLEYLGPTAGDHDVEAISRDYLDVVNARLRETGLSVDENGDVLADGFVDDDPRELVDDALFRANLQAISERHRR
ncbi:hypothetical protein [Lentzea sp. NPDC059081]|uniref:hypothetical protein n=1 Tax=Lentzea sp. NPDC059081 TaxID=3346719 RepID=UPI003695F194